MRSSKILSSILLASTLAFSQELNSEKFQLVAQDIKTKEEIITALGKVVIVSPTYYLSANKVIYNKQKESFELFGNVIIIKDNNLQTQSEYAYINLQDESSLQKPVFLYEGQSDIWANSKSAKKENNRINLDSTIMSSCDCLNPDWSIRASSANYNTEEKWVNSYNTRLYFKNIPVFYTPYLGFPTDKTRRTGLLIPTLGYSNKDGLYYSQPIYFAPAANYDIEFVPQIRNRRGYGLYSYFRYADSPYSLLKIQAGGFKEQKSYQLEQNLKNQKHYGWNLDYERTKLFSNDKTQDGLYASINNMNDIEYKTLENEDTVSTDKKVESKLNYFYNTSKYYGGVYGRYYIDTSKDSNGETLQELPQLQFHSYTRELPIKNLLYTFDTRYINYTRKKGLTANLYKFTLPFTYSKYFYDDYLYISAENKTVVSKYTYSNNDNANVTFENGDLIQNKTSLTIGSDLIKPYTDYIHTLNLSATYSHPRNIVEEGDLYKITTEDDSTKQSVLSSFPITQDNKNIYLSLNQSLYKKDSLKQFINHKISQSILYNKLDEPKFQNLENYLKVNYDYGTITNRLTYNMQDKQLIENDIDLTFAHNNLSLTLGYYKSKETDNSGKENLESYSINTSYKISKDYKIGYYENYNLQDDVRSKQGLKFDIYDNCWNLALKFERQVVPSTTNDDKSIDQKIIYLNLELKPIGGINQQYKIKDKDES